MAHLLKESKKHSKVLTKDKIKSILEKNRLVFNRYKVYKFGLFGSYAQNKATAKSDVDLLVEFKEVIDLFEYAKLQGMLQGLLKKNVDLATPDSIKPYIRAKVLSEVEWFERL